jgi:hypothetical protein
MDNKIQLVKTNFNNIKEIRTNVMYCFNALEIKLTKLKNTTNEFVKNNKHNIFVFGLDSFQFQGKLIDYEYNDMRKFYFALNNRMYCEYYKLYKLIIQYAEEIIGTNKNIEMLKSQAIFPIYKDLEPFKQYNFETIEEIHKTIVTLLNDLNEHIIAKETQLQLFHLKQRSGLNINNFVTTFDFDVIVIKQKCLLYLSYLEFFHNIHTKHFKRFSKKMKLMNDYLDEDIKFDEGMNVKEDDSIKSSSSSSSFDYVENLIDSPTNIFDNKNSNPSSIKTLIKSNVKKVMNSFKISKPDITPLSEQNIAISFSEIDNNLNKITDSFTSSELNEIVANNETTNAVVSEPNILPTETMIVANHDVNSDQNVEVSETINAHVSESTEPKIESMSLQTCALILSQDSNISDTINDHKLESIEVTSETMESEEEEEKNDKPETKVNKKKRNKKKKK